MYFIFLFNLPIFIFYKKICKILNVYDKPDKKRKLKKSSVPLTGGLIIIYNFIIFLLINYFFDINIVNSVFFQGNKELFGFIFSSFLFFLLGYLDDKFDIEANIKLFFLSIIIIITYIFDNKFLITELNFSFYSKTIFLSHLSFFVTLLCCLLFINALNMFDGVNLQAGTYAIIIFVIFILKSVFINLSIVLIVSILIFLYFNYNNKAYLGNSGVLFLAYVISYFFIKTNNINHQLFKADEVFIIMIVPGLDMLRLFLQRILDKKHPFKADRMHLHHLLLKFYSEKKVFIIIQCIILFLIYAYYLLAHKFYFLVVVTLLYILFINILIKKNRIVN
jgi:UDP-GlcNAc:undecaprenyl-phosphate GlcNAc-1-phosphate transferase